MQIVKYFFLRIKENRYLIGISSKFVYKTLLTNAKFKTMQNK